MSDIDPSNDDDSRGDRRVRRTKKALHAALVHLMVERGYEKTSIQDIVEQADVGRSTFYSHYADKDDLLQETVEGLAEFLRSAAASTTSAGHPALSFSAPMFIHIAEMRRLSPMLFGTATSTVHEYIHDMLADLVREKLGSDRCGGLDSGVVVEYVVGSFLAVARWWIVEGQGHSAADTEKIFLDLVSPGLEAAAGSVLSPRQPVRRVRIPDK